MPVINLPSLLMFRLEAARAMEVAPAEDAKVVDPKEEKDEDSDETVKKVMVHLLSRCYFMF